MRAPKRPFRRIAMTSALGIVLVASALPAAGPANAAASIPPGFDLFETDAASTESMLTIPADFFAPGSDPFSGVIRFSGVPLEMFGGSSVGDADTVVQRMLGADPMPGLPDTIPIEIVALNLVSTEPITVTFGGQFPQKWDVEVDLSPTRPSTGQMTIDRPAPTGGGTFDATLEVVPRFTFTDLIDGHTRTLDGAVLPPPQLTLVETDVPWLPGCSFPALAVTGLNDGFCPGLTPTGKQLSIAQGPLTQHGIYPAQNAPEHFKCYTLKRRTFPDKNVTLTDEFSTRAASATERKELCNPVQKRAEPFKNRRAHLTCYGTAGYDPNLEVAVRNQFGSQHLDVGEARRLCVPSQKRKLKQQFKPITIPIDHRQCYSVTPHTAPLRFGPIGQIRLEDQFGVEQVNLGPAVQLCVPVDKDSSQIWHPIHYLVCYKIVDARKEVTVEIDNQFERRMITTLRPSLLCVPSAEVIV